MATYNAKAQLLVRRTGRPDVEHVEPGEIFQSDAVPGRNWLPIDDEAKAAVRARFGKAAVADANRFLFQAVAQTFDGG